MSEFRYNSQQAAAIFQVSIETVRTWSIEFESYLSPEANPGDNRRRSFNQDDLEVLALVSELKAKRATYQEIRIALDNGQRGRLEAPPPHEVDTLALATREQLQLQVKSLQTRVEQLQAELETARATYDEVITLRATLDATQVQLEEAKAELKAARDTIESLSREAGQQYAKGFTEGFREAWKNNQNSD